MASTKISRDGQRLPFRFTAHHHVDGRVEAQLKVRGRQFARALIETRKLKTVEELADTMVQFIIMMNNALARAQRREMSRGPTQEIKFDEEDDQGG